MFRQLLTAFSLMLISALGYSQNITLTGQVRDTGYNKPVVHAVVALITAKDSVLTVFTRTNAEGKFRLQQVPPANYSLVIMHPQFADYVDELSLTADKDVATIPLTAKSKLLEAVILRSSSPIRIKGDTTIYTADSFKVGANANVEELLKKMPGFQVDKNGQIKSMGEVVEKVLVDGEEFFGDDPGMAVKNLRADAVKEVQVFNKKSDQAEFTGIDDGKTKKTINLKLKDDKKHGYFGKIDLAGGLQKDIPDRYNTNTMLSAFKGKRKFTGFLLSGNTGQDGLSWEDQEKFGGENENFSMTMDDDGGMMFISKGGGSDDEPYVNTQNGFIQNINSGVQYSNNWNDKHKFNFSPKFNSQVYDNNENKYTLRKLPGDQTITERSNTNSYVNRYNIKNTLSYDLKIDTSNSLKLTLRANFYKTQSEDSITMQRYGTNNELLNTTDKRVTYDNDKTSFNGSALFRHKFKKARRTLSFNTDWSILSQDGNNYLTSLNKDYETGSPSIIEVDQLRDNEKSNTRNSARFVYTEPIGKKYSIELSHEIALIRGINKQLTYTYTPATQKYDQEVDSLTNDFKQRITVNTPTAKLLYNGKKTKFNVGGGISLTNFDLEDRTNGKHYQRNYSNFSPAANFIYNYKSNHSLRFNYNGTTSQPSVNQLQPLRNINDQYNQYIGNPELKPSFTHNINVSHNGYNFIKDRWMYQSLNVRIQENAIMNKLDYQGGKLVTQPVNTDGNYSIGLWSGIGFKSKKIDTRFNIGPHLNYSQNADLVNGQKTFSKIGQYGLWSDIQKSKDKKYEFSLNEEFGYNRSRSSNNNLLSTYITTRTSFNTTLYYKKVWSLQTDYAYTYNQKVNEFGKDFTNHLWNATLKKTFKDNTYTAYFSVRDILDQNTGFQQNYYGTTYIETRNDRLKRYWMIGFRWDFKNKGTTPAK